MSLSVISEASTLLSCYTTATSEQTQVHTRTYTVSAEAVSRLVIHRCALVCRAGRGLRLGCQCGYRHATRFSCLKSDHQLALSIASPILAHGDFPSRGLYHLMMPSKSTNGKVDLVFLKMLVESTGREIR